MRERQYYAQLSHVISRRMPHEQRCNRLRAQLCESEREREREGSYTHRSVIRIPGFFGLVPLYTTRTYSSVMQSLF